jgi:RNA polymerase sigma-70 factor (ECF subfamily)
VVGDVVVGIADEELVERVRRGDAQAFRVLVDRHRAWLTARCRRHLGGDAHAAEDVAQECLVALQRTVVSGEKPMRVRPWLSVVARNRCIDEARKLRAVPTATVPDAAVFDPEVGAEDPHLMRAWSALTGRHRTVLELRELGGLSYEEIAVALAVTAGAVETLLFRARGALRREYARAGGKVAAMAPIQEAVAQAAGRQGVLSRLAGEAGVRLDGVSSLVGRGPSDLAGAADGALASASDGGSATGWLTDLQARLVSSPAFEPVVNAGAAGPGGGRLRIVLAGLGVLLGTVAVTLPALDGASSSTTPPASTATVPSSPAPAPGTTTATAPEPSSAAVDGDPAASAPEAPSTPDAEPPPAPTGPSLPEPLAPLVEPVSPVLDRAGATVTSIVEGVQAPLDGLLGPVVRPPGS